MSLSLKSLSGLSLRLLLLPLVLMLTVSCSSGALGILTGGGPNVAANVQAGKTNSQTIGTTNNIAPTVSIRPDAKVDKVDQSTTQTKVSSDEVHTVVINEVPAWVVLLLILGWLLPSPQEIGRGFLGLFKVRRR
jgi:hypothetical protein